MIRGYEGDRERRGIPGGDKCYCKVNANHLSIAGVVEGREIKRIDRQGGSSAGGESRRIRQKCTGCQHLAAAGEKSR